jgi:hypothetical protein
LEERIIVVSQESIVEVDVITGMKKFNVKKILFRPEHSQIANQVSCEGGEFLKRFANFPFFVNMGAESSKPVVSV